MVLYIYKEDLSYGSSEGEAKMLKEPWFECNMVMTQPVFADTGLNSGPFYFNSDMGSDSAATMTLGGLEI